MGTYLGSFQIEGGDPVDYIPVTGRVLEPAPSKITGETAATFAVSAPDLTGLQVGVG